jgi:hypothetical protein
MTFVWSETEKLIDDSDILTNDDKNILKTAYKTNNTELYKTLSFISNDGIYKKINDIEYFESNGEAYYINTSINHLCDYTFIDKNKKVIYGSRPFFSKHYIIYGLKTIIQLLKYIKTFDINNCIYIDQSIVSAQKWANHSYGHFKDDFFNSCNFKIITSLDVKILVDIDKKFNFYNIYEEMVDYSIGIDNIINTNNINSNLLKFNKVYLVHNDITSKLFHSFPLNVTNTILNKIPSNIIHDKIFITRNNDRTFDNLKEIEEHFKSNNVFIINPEDHSYSNLIKNIRNANKVFITWGSALTNLIYLKEETSVIILKSEYYETQPIIWFQRIIDTYKLKVQVIDHENNCIDLNKIII